MEQVFFFGSVKHYKNSRFLPEFDFFKWKILKKMKYDDIIASVKKERFCNKQLRENGGNN